MRIVLWNMALVILTIIVAGCGLETQATPTAQPPTSPTATLTPTHTPPPTHTPGPTVAPTVAAPETPTATCETHTVSTSLTSSASTVWAGDVVTIGVELVNRGCGMIGLPRYRLLVKSIGSEPIFDPAEPEPLEHDVGLGSGDSDVAEFTLRAIKAGRATLTARASFEVHLGYPAPAYWSGSEAGEPLVITVAERSTSAAPEVTPTPTVELDHIGTITVQRVGEEVTVEGTVVDAASFSQGFKFTLDDGSGQIVLLMWHEVYDACWDASKINLGATVWAEGRVSQYEGQLQIEPRFGGDVKVTGDARAHAPRREIGSITAADAGQRIWIEGEVVRIEGLPSAVKVFLREDGAAGQREIVVFIWRNVLERIADNTGLGTVGSRVRVVGRVQVYRSNLEIVPALPADVTVLDIP